MILTFMNEEDLKGPTFGCSLTGIRILTRSLIGADELTSINFGLVLGLSPPPSAAFSFLSPPFSTRVISEGGGGGERNKEDYCCMLSVDEPSWI